MKVVIDTNVLVSAALKDRTPEEVLLFVFAQPDITWVASREIVEEYLAVLGRPRFRLPADVVQRWANILAGCEIIEVSAEMDFPRDQGDAKFLACALSARADYLITGDKDFVEAKTTGATSIVSASWFKTTYLDGGISK